MLYLVTAGFIILDFITGIVSAFKECNFSSAVMRQGLFHKTGSVLCVVFGMLVDYGQGITNLGVSIPTAPAIATYIIIMECGSIIENVGRINPEIMPAMLKKYFEKLGGK